MGAEESGGLDMTGVLNTPDVHVFGQNPATDPIVVHQPTADFHTRRARINADFEAAVRRLAAKHAAERAALEAEYSQLHQESRDIFAGRSK
jgi:hypothetical protein